MQGLTACLRGVHSACEEGVESGDKGDKRLRAAVGRVQGRQCHRRMQCLHPACAVISLTLLTSPTLPKSASQESTVKRTTQHGDLDGT